MSDLLDLTSLAEGLTELSLGDLTDMFVSENATNLISGTNTVSRATVAGHDVTVNHTLLPGAHLTRATLIYNDRPGTRPYWSVTTNIKNCAIDVSVTDPTGDTITLDDLLRSVVNSTSANPLDDAQWATLRSSRGILGPNMVMMTIHNGTLRSTVEELFTLMARHGAIDVTDTIPRNRRNGITKVMDFGNAKGLPVSRLSLSSTGEGYDGFKDLVNAQVANLIRMLNNAMLRREASAHLKTLAPTDPTYLDAADKVAFYRRAASTWLNNWGGAIEIKRIAPDAIDDPDATPQPTGEYRVNSVPVGNMTLASGGELIPFDFWANRTEINAELDAERGTLTERLTTGLMASAAIPGLDDEPISSNEPFTEAGAERSEAPTVDADYDESDF